MIWQVVLGLASAVVVPREKSTFNFNNLYGSVFNPKTKSYSWIGDAVIQNVFGGSNPRNTYQGFITTNDGVIMVDTLFPCSESDVCQQPDGLPLLWTNQSPRPIFDPTTFPDDDFSGSYVFSANYDLVAYRVKYEKRWRHSYKASYQVYKTKYFNNDNGEAVEEKLVLIENVWLFSFEPSPLMWVYGDDPRQKVVYVDDTNNLYFRDFNAGGVEIAITTDADKTNGILNGIPDWVYEEEMLGSRSATWWSPNGHYIFYMKSYTKDIENVNYNYYGKSDDYRRRADDVTVKDMSDINPRVESIPYSKPGGKITQVELFVSSLKPGEGQGWSNMVVVPDDVKEFLGGEDLLLSKVEFDNEPYSTANGVGTHAAEGFVTMMNRIQTRSVTLQAYACCDDVNVAEIEPMRQDTDNTGWVDAPSISFDTQKIKFFLKYTQNACNQLQAVVPNIGDYIPRYFGEMNVVAWDDTTTSEPVCIQSISFVSDNFIYFYASTPNKSYERHLYRVDYSTMIPFWDGMDEQWIGGDWTPKPFSEWECMTCVVHEGRVCGYASMSTTRTRDYAILTCSGPEVPYYLPMKLDFESKIWNIASSSTEQIEANDDLIQKIEKKMWPVRSFGKFKSNKFDVGEGFNYELWIPEGVDITQGSHPLLIEIYGGAGSTKITAAWRKAWTQTYMASQFNIVVASLDGRGSGRRGNGLMHSTYKKIGQFEKEDASDFAAFLLQKYPSLDKRRIGIWGWSFGGYATTLSLLHNNTVFTTGVAVAPLATRYNYDSMHTERFMVMPEDNIDGYNQCSILNQNLTNMQNKQYTIIAGTMDDNVHFQNAAVITKAFIRNGIDIDARFFADEGHSINYSEMNNRHIYRTITRRFIEYYRLTDYEKDTWYNKDLDANE